jgi:hypothetical protein
LETYLKNLLYNPIKIFSNLLGQKNLIPPSLFSIYKGNRGRVALRSKGYALIAPAQFFLSNDKKEISRGAIRA